MDFELIKDIATIASPIIGVIAIIVALIISYRSSRDAQRQDDIEYEQKKKEQKKNLDQLKQQHKKIVWQKQIIESFLQKQ